MGKGLGTLLSQYLVLCPRLFPGLAFLHRPWRTGEPPGGRSFPGRWQLCSFGQLDRQLILFAGPATSAQQPLRTCNSAAQHLPVPSLHWGCRHHQGVLCFLDHGSYQCEFMTLLHELYEWCWQWNMYNAHLCIWFFLIYWLKKILAQKKVKNAFVTMVGIEMKTIIWAMKLA